jgi:hypothetical protein
MAIVGKGERSVERQLWLMLYPVLPCVIGRDEVFLEHWLRLLLLATHSLNIIHRHRLLHETWLRLYKIAGERHHLLRKMSREVARLLHVRHELIRLWCHLRVHVRIEHIRHLAWLHLHLHLHRRSRHGSSLESDMGSSIRSSTILKSRRPEDHALAVTLTVAFRLDAIFAYRSLFTTLDAAFTTSQTSGFGSLAGEFGPEGCLCLGGVSAVQGELVVALIVGRVVSGVGIHLAEVWLVGEERVVGMDSACFGRVPGEVLGKARVCPSAWLDLLVVQEWWLVRAGGTRPMQTVVS